MPNLNANIVQTLDTAQDAFDNACRLIINSDAGNRQQEMLLRSVADIFNAVSVIAAEKQAARTLGAILMMQAVGCDRNRFRDYVDVCDSVTALEAAVIAYLSAVAAAEAERIRNMEALAHKEWCVMQRAKGGAA